MPKITEGSTVGRVGVIGAGQLARMLGESASALGIELIVLASRDDDAAVGVASAVLLGNPYDAEAISQLSNACDVVTCDHELVSLDALQSLHDRGRAIHPSARALRFAAHKDFQRRDFSAAGLPVPRFVVLDSYDVASYETFRASLDAPPVVKAARGGYDGRGVVLSANDDEALAAISAFSASGPVVVEERIDVLGEYAIQVATSTSGERVWWPLVATVQRDGMCAEVTFPSGCDELLEQAALSLCQRVADRVDAVGVLAIELFLTPEGFVVNEVATRPHNSAHWTIEGCATSQFENHLRAVLGLPLGVTDAAAPAVTMVNLVGAAEPGDMSRALAVRGAHIHNYGKSWRAGRKLGHVTVTGRDGADVRVRAWLSAEALGTVFTRESE